MSYSLGPKQVAERARQRSTGRKIELNKAEENKIMTISALKPFFFFYIFYQKYICNFLFWVLGGTTSQQAENQTCLTNYDLMKLIWLTCWQSIACLSSETENKQ